jgi:16S rRNA (uracil1498-N3)-methyltransferase
MANRFFTPDPLAPGEYVLAGPDAHHLATVRRLRPGDHIVLFNGDGNEYPAEILTADRKRTLVNIRSVEPVCREATRVLHVAAAMPKGDRGDFLIEKLVELGVARFTPLITERTVVQPKESRIEKLHQAVIEASKQCGRNVLMAVDPPTRWPDLLTRVTDGVRIVLHPGESGAGAGTGPMTVAVGPEGGFTPSEVAEAEGAGWARMSLGPRILRVETAAITAAARLIPC